jgi:hypothetical protein
MVIGPVDGATPEASDALLKTLEDLVEGSVLICLWADCIGGVAPTIRSRTAHVWCPPDATWVDPVLPFVEDGRILVSAILSGDRPIALGLIATHSAVKDRNGSIEPLLRGAVRALAAEMGSGDPDRARHAVSLWRRFRPALRNPTILGTVSAIVGGPT